MTAKLYMPDVNVLIYAHREDSATHIFYRTWLERVMNGDQQLALSSLVAGAFVRIVTSRAYPSGASSVDAAVAFVDSLVGHGNCVVHHPSDRHWSLVSQIVRAGRFTGSAIADVQHAAVAMEHGCTWITRDSDFTRLEQFGLRLAMLEP